MKNKKLILFLITFVSFICLGNLQKNVKAVNVNTPYHTYTADAYGRLVKSTDAYTPSLQISKVGRDTFTQIENIFVDENDYVYITDSAEFKIYILNENFELFRTINMRTGKPVEFDSPISTFVTKDKIYIVDGRDGKKIVILDKKELLENNNIVVLDIIQQPTAPVFDQGYKFIPKNIVVDARGNIYVQGAESPNGLMMMDEDGNFLTFFGGNPLRLPFMEQIRSYFLTEEQKETLRKTGQEGQRALTETPTNIAMDSKGYIYTVTSTLERNPIKKFNVAGTNFFKNNMIGTENMSSVWVGRYNNVFSVNSNGYIFEYDSSGNLLFLFGGKESGSHRIGLLNTPVSIATNSRDQIIVADQGAKLIQIYEPTTFTNSVHEALDEYQKGNYDKSLEKWEYILQYNSLFDYAHIGLGDAFLRNNQFKEAHKEYSYAQYYKGMSDAYWGIRQDWMKDNLATVLLIIVLIAVMRITYLLLNKRYNYRQKLKGFMKKIRSKSQVLDELLYIFTFLKHPFNGFYDIKINKVSVKTSTIIYLLLAWIFILNYQFTNELFVPKFGVNIAYELFIIVLIVVLWVVSNYLVCSINDGEGSFKNVYNATAYSLSPILVIMPLIIIFSNVLTYQEVVFYSFGYTLITVWVAFLLFFMIKDIHNYEVKQTIGVIFKSMFTMFIIGLMLFIINALSSQMFTIISEIVTEVSKR